MRIIGRQERWLAGLLIAGSALAAMAPLAEAGHGHGRRYRAPVVVRRAYDWDGARAPRHIYVARGSGTAPALAGFFGGLILGAVLADGASPHVLYRDPYCHEDFASLEIYSSHCRAHAHARAWTVIEGDGDRGCGGDRYERRYRDDRWDDDGDDGDDD